MKKHIFAALALLLFSLHSFAQVAASAGDTHAPSANTDAVVTYAAGGAGTNHVIRGIVFGYSAAPTGGTLKVEDGSGVIVFGPIPITSAGAGFIPLTPGMRGTAGTALIITLKAGGAGISGVVTVTGHTTD